MKRFFLALSLVLLVLPFSCKNKGKEATGPARPIIILHENDVHCAVDGYAKLAGLRDSLQDSAYVAVVSSGDYLQGGMTGVLSNGSYIMDIQQAVGYDALALGNHEFDYFAPRLFELIDQYKAPAVCANLYDARTGERCLPAYTIRQYGPTKVAFIGVTTPETEEDEYYALHDENGEKIYDLKAETLYALVQQTVDEVRAAGADYVIVLGHLGEVPTAQKVDSHGFIAATTGIDAVLDGHTHSVVPAEYLANKDGKPVLIAQTGTAWENIGKLTIATDGTLSHTLVPVAELTEEDPAVAAVIADIKQQMEVVSSRVLGDSEVYLTINDPAGKRVSRSGECNLGDLLCDAMRHWMDADIALANGGGIRASIPAGTLTYGDIINVFPFVNYVYKIEATGDDILQVIEHCTRKAPQEEEGDFPQCSGIRYTVHTTDRRLSDVAILRDGEWEPIDPDKTYTVATINYCVNGGGFGHLFEHCRILRTSDMYYRDAVANYIVEVLGGHVGQTYAEPQGRIRFVK